MIVLKLIGVRVGRTVPGEPPFVTARRPLDRPFGRLTVRRRSRSQGPELVEGLGALSRFDKLKAPSLSRGLSNGGRLALPFQLNRSG